MKNRRLRRIICRTGAPDFVSGWGVRERRKIRNKKSLDPAGVVRDLSEARFQEERVHEHGAPARFR